MGRRCPCHRAELAKGERRAQVAVELIWRAGTESSRLGRYAELAKDEQSGQAAVELALLIPVIVAVALLTFNIMRFAELCARFDRVAPDAVLAHGVSPAGSSGELAGVDAVSSAIKKGMGDASCEVKVSVEDLSVRGAGSAVLTLAAGTTRFNCTMSYTPWPASVSIAGVGFQLPSLASHERSIVVDRWKAAIVT